MSQIKRFSSRKQMKRKRGINKNMKEILKLNKITAVYWMNKNKQDRKS